MPSSAFRPLILAILAAGASTWAPNARACGGIASQVALLLPEDGATEVPLNVALQASSSLFRVAFELVTVETGELVPVSVSCDGHFDGNFCFASPGPLKPNTAYLWRASPEGEEVVEPLERSFITGDSHDSESPIINNWSLEVVEDAPPVGFGCDGSPGVTFRFQAGDSQESLVLTPLPSWDHRGILVPAGESVRFAMPAPPCFSVRLTDSAGNAAILPSYCPDGRTSNDADSSNNVAPVTTESESADEDSSSPDSSAKCSVGRLGTPPRSSALLSFPFAVLLYRRRLALRAARAR